ncbi:putative uncharacterized protein DDB_G0271982 [Nilaparvata lugens]|uniref:putative uncharacterized protein DDB_G0271982 n=1 Tax=Nilaparvata lugens TaxID=108931 RepID=UPI00193EA861|nr:putative uncharacterized protein DDB_G0271982 [Nilaparvata lugens]
MEDSNQNLDVSYPVALPSGPSAQTDAETVDATPSSTPTQVDDEAETPRSCEPGSISSVGIPITWGSICPPRSSSGMYRPPHLHTPRDREEQKERERKQQEERDRNREEQKERERKQQEERDRDREKQRKNERKWQEEFRQMIAHIENNTTTIIRITDMIDQKMLEQTEAINDVIVKLDQFSDKLNTRMKETSQIMEPANKYCASMEDQPTQDVHVGANLDLAEHQGEPEDAIHQLKGQPKPPTASTTNPLKTAPKKRPCAAIPEVQTPASHATEPPPPTGEHTPEHHASILLSSVDIILGAIRENSPIMQEFKEETGKALERLDQKVKGAAEDIRMVAQQIEEKCHTIKISIGPVIERLDEPTIDTHNQLDQVSQEECKRTTKMEDDEHAIEEPIHAEMVMLEEEVIEVTEEHFTKMSDQPTQDIKLGVDPHCTKCQEEPEDAIHHVEGQPEPLRADHQESKDIAHQVEE